MNPTARSTSCNSASRMMSNTRRQEDEQPQSHREYATVRESLQNSARLLLGPLADRPSNADRLERQAATLREALRIVHGERDGTNITAGGSQAEEHDDDQQQQQERQ